MMHFLIVFCFGILISNVMSMQRTATCISKANMNNKYNKYIKPASNTETQKRVFLETYIDETVSSGTVSTIKGSYERLSSCEPPPIGKVASLKADLEKLSLSGTPPREKTSILKQRFQKKSSSVTPRLAEPSGTVSTVKANYERLSSRESPPIGTVSTVKANYERLSSRESPLDRPHEIVDHNIKDDNVSDDEVNGAESLAELFTELEMILEKTRNVKDAVPDQNVINYQYDNVKPVLTGIKPTPLIKTTLRSQVINTDKTDRLSNIYIVVDVYDVIESEMRYTMDMKKLKKFITDDTKNVAAKIEDILLYERALSSKSTVDIYRITNIYHPITYNLMNKARELFNMSKGDTKIFWSEILREDQLTL